MPSQQILDAIPHRPPMLLLDEVVDWQPEHIVCRKTFQPEEWFFQGHYPDYPLVPGVILCEAAMQAGAVLKYWLWKHIPSRLLMSRPL
jgi:3-hydroxyacyl-[acyl-carrier-protein] dehydratase